MVSLDAAHTCIETAQNLVLKHGANYLLTVKGNQPTVKKNIELSLDGDAALIKKAPEPSYNKHSERLFSTEVVPKFQSGS